MSCYFRFLPTGMPRITHSSRLESTDSRRGSGLKLDGKSRRLPATWHGPRQRWPSSYRPDQTRPAARSADVCIIEWWMNVIEPEQCAKAKIIQHLGRFRLRNIGRG